MIEWKNTMIVTNGRHIGMSVKLNYPKKLLHEKNTKTGLVFANYFPKC